MIMKKAYYLFVITLLAVITLSCNSGRPLAAGPSDNNKSYKVEYLFEHDGCKIYRFYDNRSYVYFSNCTGNVTAISNDSIKKRTHTITNRQ